MLEWLDSVPSVTGWESTPAPELRSTARVSFCNFLLSFRILVAVAQLVLTTLSRDRYTQERNHIWSNAYRSVEINLEPHETPTMQNQYHRGSDVPYQARHTMKNGIG